MGSESVQNRLGRDRPPRVHIHYKVETGGAIELIELPFVVGVMADLSGDRETPLEDWTDRQARDINAATLDNVLAEAAPRVAFTVPNVLTEGEGGQSELPVDIKFKKYADFNPANVAKQVEPLNKLLELQQSLKEIKRRIMSNPEFGKRLEGVMKDRDLLETILETQEGAPGTTPPAEPTKPEATT